MRTYELHLKNEYKINSIYSFISPNNYDIPLIPWVQKVKYLARWAAAGNEGAGITEETIKGWIENEPSIHFPIECDQEDIEYVINTWAEENLPENQFVRIEVVDDRNTGYFRVLHFELKKNAEQSGRKPEEISSAYASINLLCKCGLKSKDKDHYFNEIKKVIGYLGG